MKRWRHEREFEKRWGDVTAGLMAGLSGLVFVVHFLFVPLRHPLLAATLVMFTVAIESSIALALRNQIILSLDPRERLRKRNGEAPIVVLVAHSAPLLESFLEGRITTNGRIVKVCSRRLTLITALAAGVAVALFTAYVLVSLSGPA